ncbi:hypothetical protein B0H13DRAFT_2343496 [Mycena leptocephala]|nr:hypothetical protein B0H13DRAFT_2343496 [Mycena leptocephala]
MGVIFGFAVGWGSLASDYNAGLIFPLVLIQWPGAAIMCIAGGPAPSNDARELWQVLHSAADVYSIGLSTSVIGAWLSKVPQLIWPITITAIYIPIAITGANSFSSLDFMNVLGYWLSIFVVVVLLKHFVFHKGHWAQYNAAETWNR